MSTQRDERYEMYSHFNFDERNWLEAARRYLKLEEALQAREEEDEEVDHELLRENFARCELCEEIQELQDDRAEFATAFAAIWAKKAIEAMRSGETRRV